MLDCPAMDEILGVTGMERMSWMENNVVFHGAGAHGFMQAVAGLLHIGMREPFCIEGVPDTRFFFSEDGLYAARMAADAPEMTLAELQAAAVLDKEHLCDLLSGAACIRMEPFVPVEPDYYYYMADDEAVHGRNWHGTFADYAHAAAGNCFRTEEEVLRYLPQFTEKLKAAYQAARGISAQQQAEDRDEMSLFDE